MKSSHKSVYSSLSPNHLELETKLESARSMPSPTPAVLQELSVLLAKATKTLADATGSIPTYDQKQHEIVSPKSRIRV